MKSVCKIQPIRAEIYENGVLYQKPCGLKYSTEEVHCEKYHDRTCEYMALKHINQQQLEAYDELKRKGEIL
jgi:hypothetical protein